MIVAGCYARKSTDEPDKDDREKSVPGQIELARAYAKRKGWRFDEGSVFKDEAVTGRNFKTRPGLNKLKAALVKPKFQALIVREFERLGRPPGGEGGRLEALVGRVRGRRGIAVAP